MKPLPKDRDLLLRLLDEIKAISASLANKLLHFEMEMKHETELRELHREFPPNEQFDKIITEGVGSTQFREQLQNIDDVAVTHLSALAEYLSEKEVTLVLDENDRSRAECRPDWNSAARILPDLHEGDDNKRLQALFAVRDSIIRIVRVRMRVFNNLAMMINRLRVRIENAVTEISVSEAEGSGKKKQRSRKQGMSADEANMRVRKYFTGWRKKDPKANKLPSQREIAEAIGCGKGSVAKLPAYQAVVERWDRTQQRESNPKAINLSHNILKIKGEGKRDSVLSELIENEEQEKKKILSNNEDQQRTAELSRLIEEQEREAKRDPSPLKNDQPDRRTTARAYKKV